MIATAVFANSAGEHPKRIGNGFSFNSPVAMDVLPDTFCPDCDGLEIVAGNEVFSVNLVTGVCAVQVTAPAGYSDGFTSIADFDRDGDLDAIVQGEKNGVNTLYVWDIQTSTILREYQLPNNWKDGASRVNVADLNGDGQLEVSFIEYPLLIALNNDFSVMWTRPTTDASSITCSSVFDFCGDGTSDVIYRGQDKLQVIEGATGQIKWEDDCLSLTHIENPLVLDVDGDGQTEIVIECGQNGSTVLGTVVAYEAVGSPGIASRRVWNQHAYFSTNINDDLTVPAYQQNPSIIGDSLKMNTFLNQYFSPSFPTPDGQISIQNVQCVGDSLDLTLLVCNGGDNLLPPLTPVSLYVGNPQTTAANWVGAAPLGFGLFPDSCLSFTFRVPRLANDSVFLVLNDDHSLLPPFSLTQDFPVTAIGECAFDNNIAGFYFDYQPAVVDLGPDSTLCGDEVLAFDASGNQLLSWQWQDGSMLPTFSTTGPGTYAVAATDICGIMQLDTIQVYLDTSTVVLLGSDRVICAGESFELGETGFDYYNWSPAASLSCANCATVTVTPPATGFVVLQAGFNTGCKSVDTVFVTVHPTFDYTVDTTICYGRVVDWFGTVVPPDSLHVFSLQTFQGCDSIVRVNVIGTTIGTYQILVDTSVCLGSTIIYNGVTLQPGEEKIYNLSALTGCDSTVLLRVLPKDTFATAESLVICYGETASIFGQPVNQTGNYRQTFTAQNGCDSTHTVGLTVLNPILIALDATPTCYNETGGALNALVSGGASPFAYSWSNSQSTAQIQYLPAGAYQLTVTDANDCTETASGLVDAYPPIVFGVATDSVLCYGETTGAIHLNPSDPSYLFQLDGSAFAQTTDYNNLGAGIYEVQVQDINGCIDTLDVTVAGPPPLLLALPQDMELQLGDSIQLPILQTAIGPIQYDWSDTSYLSCLSCPNPTVFPLASVQYVLKITDENGCTASDDIYIRVERVVEAFLPNIINLSASNDYNNSFRPGFGPSVKRVQLLQIYSRWGELLHDIRNVGVNDAGLVWNGKQRGQWVDPGVYLWVIEIELVDGSIVRRQGDLSVIR
ncbi:MAG: hypothetical protein IPL65_14180 [Lewinellaceae bacterium]|nr:hypothetical protein [Lewinellaceae bacterium]